jgi:hypothetical protein
MVPGSEDTLVTSGNPIIRHIRSADPAAKVWNDGRVWIYASHDQDDATDYSTMDGYHVFSSYDLVNWTDHGEILHSRDVSWGNPDGGWMFAPDAAFKDGTYYLYFPHLSSEWRWRIGVATSPVPEGPFTDMGHYIEGTDHIDPACFVDEDGQAYLLWGGGDVGTAVPKIARLKENMTELAEEPRTIEYGANNFGEGGYLHKRNGIYYFSYTCHSCWPHQAYYAMGDSPYGPFEYKGELNRNPPGAQDHHSMVEFHGQWYYFYHVGNYDGGSINRRNICIDSLHYNEDGTMKEVIQTATGVGRDLIGSTPGKIIPGRFEAELHFRSVGVSSLSEGDTAVVAGEIEDGDWVEYVLDVLGTEIYTAQLRLSDAQPGAGVCLIVDDVVSDSILIESDTSMVSFPLYLHEGKHTLKLLFSHADTTLSLMNLDWVELTGDTEYFYVQAIVDGEGSVEPAGTTYYPRGDTAEFRLEAAFNHILDSVWIDGILQPLSAMYSFTGIAENHTIKTSFSACMPVPFTPFYQVNEEAPVNGTDVRITEGNSLRLWVDHDSTALLSWNGPGGFTGSVDTIFLDSIRVSQQGNYMASLMNSQGCLTQQVFDISVSYVKLDVYEAEHFFDQSGVSLGTCTDIGGGKYLGTIENNDHCWYTVSINDPGYYRIIARVATAAEGGSIEISARDSLLATIPVDGSNSDGWDDWFTTDPVEIGFKEGVKILKFNFRGGEGYLFNYNWFDLEFSRDFTDTLTSALAPLSLHSYPNPFATSTQIVFTLERTSDVDLHIFNSSGSLISAPMNNRRLAPGRHSVTWEGTNGSRIQAEPGIYLIRLRCNNEVIYQKVVLLTKE